MSNLFESTYNPDVLSCIANLSSDEVFTPPEIANQMLDMLPDDLWRNPNARFLDPATKSGIFLREIAKRLITGLEDAYPDLQERLDHIYREQLFGIAITELTSLLTRRSLYCSKYPNSIYSVVRFDNAAGNIRFKHFDHEWVNGRCRYCGASKTMMEDQRSSTETYAYELIHSDNPKGILDNMFFDVVIGNPPYQMSFGIEGGNSANAKSIYNQFISQAIKLSPKYICMITPSRWMTKTAQGIPASWVDEMLQSNHFRMMHDYENGADCFPGVQIRGGVSYFLWDRDYEGKCEYYYHDSAGVITERFDYLDSKDAGIVVRDPRAYSILEKIASVEGNYYADEGSNFSGLVSPKHFFDDSTLLTSNWTGYKDKRSDEYCIKYYMNYRRERTFRWISAKQIPKHSETKDLWKVFIPGAGGSGDDGHVLGKPFIGEPGSICSQTFLVIGYDPHLHNYTETECQGIISYITTKTFRYLVSIKKKTQNGPRGVYQFVPLQDFTRIWTDQDLYEMYGFNDDEIAFIEEKMEPMTLGDGNA